MPEEYNEDKVFEKQDYSGEVFGRLEFVSCRFVGCDFSKSDLSGCDLMDCRFEKCNFSLVKLTNMGLKNARFVQTKVAGVDFNPCNDFLFSMGFEGCPVEYCSFWKKNLKKTVFSDCVIRETDFSEADMTECVFNRCDLSNSIFRQTRLEKADLRGAVNYQIDPEVNYIRKAKFSLFGLPGLLEKYEIVVEG